MEKDDTSHYGNLLDESRALIEFIHYLIEKESVITIGSFFSNNVNKLIVLDTAKKCGLDVPESFVVTTKQDLLNIQNNHRGKYLITKAIYEGIYRPDVKDIYQYYSYVERLTLNSINNFPDHFYPSLVQVEIEKELELRIFYIHGFCYSMAIFSQDEKGSQVDLVV